MHVNKVSTQELVQGIKMRVECKREKKKMSVDIFGKKEVYLVPSACQHLIINTFAFADTKVFIEVSRLLNHICTDCFGGDNKHFNSHVGSMISC